MDKPVLGKLERVDLRDHWKSESQHFTPWLASAENIALLGEAIDLELEVEAQEKEVGPFRADILCKDTSTGQWVLIENQLEPTDHTHLGQLLTYAAGLNAGTIVWISEHFKNEHRAALDWLNEITDEGFSFFGIEVELWRIGGSPPAPKFNVISKPNDWSKQVRASADRGTLTGAQEMQLDFWTAFREYMREHSKIRCQTPRPQNWLNSPIGRYGCHLSSVASTWDSVANCEGGELRVELVLDNDNSKTFFEQLEAQRTEVESKLGETLTWHNPSGKRMKRIYLRKAVKLADRNQWPEYREWLRQKLEAFHSVFGPRVKALVAAESDADSANA
jgi:Domain of unknown function (DUF4268)